MDTWEWVKAWARIAFVGGVFSYVGTALILILRNYYQRRRRQAGIGVWPRKWMLK